MIHRQNDNNIFFSSFLQLFSLSAIMLLLAQPEQVLVCPVPSGVGPFLLGVVATLAALGAGWYSLYTSKQKHKTLKRWIKADAEVSSSPEALTRLLGSVRDNLVQPSGAGRLAGSLQACAHVGSDLGGRGTQALWGAGTLEQPIIIIPSPPIIS